jgi:hypothetical protein
LRYLGWALAGCPKQNLQTLPSDSSLTQVDETQEMVESLLTLEFLSMAHMQVRGATGVVAGFGLSS